jgi:Ca2+-transporting ATPase
MAEPPRDKDARILPRQLAIWLLFVGLVFAAVTLSLIVWAEQAYDETIAHTMGLVAFSLLHVFFSLETADENRTIFSSELFDNPALLKATGASLLTIFLATTFGPLQRILDTTELSVDQWAICIAAAATILVVTEIRKVFRRRGMAGTEAASQPALAGQTP